MNLRTGQAWWLLANGLLKTYPPLTSDQRCRVAILGGGITGALVAERLTREGVEVVVVDKRDVATGSTVASTALLQYEIDTELLELAKHVGEANAVRAYKVGLEAIDEIERLATPECHFVRQDSLYLASRERDAKRLTKECNARRAAGLDVEYLIDSELEHRYALNAPGAILSRGDARIDAYTFTHRLLALAAERGARIFDRTTVERIEPSADGVTLTTARGTITADHLVFATGYETQEYVKGGTLHSTFALISEPMDVPIALRNTMVWETARPYFYARSTPEGRAIIGGEDSKHSTDHKRESLIERNTERLKRKFEDTFRTTYEVAYSWAGVFGETDDGLANIGQRPEWPRCWFAMGYGGNGITMSAIAAGIITDGILGRDNPDSHIYRFDR